MTRLIALVCLFLLLCCDSTYAQGGLDQRVSELSQQIATKMSARQKTTIAVIEFTDLQGNVTDFGRFLAEELITRLYDAEKFKVIERQLLSKIIAEQKLRLSGVIDPDSAKQLGRLLGVDAIVSGTITNLAQSLKGNARLIGTETREIFAVAATEIFKDDSVTGLLDNRTESPASSLKSSPSATNKTVSKLVQNEYIVELKSCKRSLNNVTCFLIITNAATAERNVSLSAGDSKLYDEAGNEYTGAQSVLGERVWDRTRYGGAYNTLISQVPMQANIKFENVSPDAKRVTLLVSARPEFKITLRDIVIN